MHGDLEEETYISIHPGFEGQRTTNKVCQLKKDNYGLQQSPRVWFDIFAKVMKPTGYR